MRVSLFAIIILTIGVVNAGIVSVPRIIYSNGTLYRNSSFTVPVYVNGSLKHVPMDVVIVVDNSPSMNRYGNVIVGGPNAYVNVTKGGGGGTYVCTFSINDTTNVEFVFQTLLTLRYDVGNKSDAFKAYLVNNTTGLKIKNTTVSSWGGKSALGDPALVRWYNLPPGKYDVYASAKGGGKWANLTRVKMVELPPEKIEIAKRLAERFVGLIDMYDRIAVVNFSTNATILLNLTSNKTSLNYTISNISAIPWPSKKGGGGGKWGSVVYNLTNLSNGLKLAIRELDDYGRPEAIKVIIVLSDGWGNTGGDPIYWATIAKSKGYYVYTVGIGGTNDSMLRALAIAGGGKYYYVTNASAIDMVYNSIVHDIEIVPKDVRIGITFTNSTYVSSYPLPSASLSSYATKVWDLGNLSSNTSLTITVVPTLVGKGILIGRGNVSYHTNLGEFYTERFLVFMNVSRPTVHPPTVENWLKLIPDGLNYTITEGELLTVNVTINSSDPQNVILSPPVIYPAPLNGSIGDVCSYSFIRRSLDSATFYFTPFYNFTESYGGNATVFAKLSAKDVVHGLKNSTIIRINVVNVNARTYPIPIVKAIGKLRPRVYVGEPIVLKLKFKNATYGNVYVNGIPIWNSTTSNDEIVNVLFIPNTAGVYVTKAVAINSTTGEKHELVLPPVEVLIKPVSP